MRRLVLVRHGQSEWNLENRFTGWTDVDLTDKGIQEAAAAGKTLKENGFHFTLAYTSYLKRAIKTLNIILDKMDLDWIPVRKTWRLNEKHYGMLQGLNKAETAEKYGDEQVHVWRRSYDVPPTELEKDDPRSPFQDTRYAQVDPKDLPLTESLKETVERILPYLHEEIPALNLPTGIPYVFELDETDNYRVIKDYFLGDPETIKKLMDAVANQGKAKK